MRERRVRSVAPSGKARRLDGRPRRKLPPAEVRVTPELPSLTVERVVGAVLRRVRRGVDGVRHRAQALGPPWTLRTARDVPSSQGTLVTPDYSDIGPRATPQDDG